MKTNPTIMRDTWIKFEKELIPPEAESDQRKEMKKAFMSGAHFMLGFLNALGGFDNPKDAERQIEETTKEIEYFFKVEIFKL